MEIMNSPHNGRQTLTVHESFLDGLEISDGALGAVSRRAAQEFEAGIFRPYDGGNDKVRDVAHTTKPMRWDG